LGIFFVDGSPWTLNVYSFLFPSSTTLLSEKKLIDYSLNFTFPTSIFDNPNPMNLFVHAIPHSPPSHISPIRLFGFKYNLIRLHKRWRWIIPPLRRFSTCTGKKPSALAEDKLQIFRKLLGVLTCFLQLLHITLHVKHRPWRLWFPKEVDWLL